jgi:hypothetical protein
LRHRLRLGPWPQSFCAVGAHFCATAAHFCNAGARLRAINSVWGHGRSRFAPSEWRLLHWGHQNDGGFFIWAPKTMAASSFGPPQRWRLLHLGPQNDGGFFIWAPTTMAAFSFGPPKRWRLLHSGHQNDGGFFIWAPKTMATSACGAPRRWRLLHLGPTTHKKRDHARPSGERQPPQLRHCLHLADALITLICCAPRCSDPFGCVVWSAAATTRTKSRLGPPKRWRLLHLGPHNDGGFFIWAPKTLASYSFGAMAAVVLRRRSALLRDRGALLRGGEAFFAPPPRKCAPTAQNDCGHGRRQS